MVELAAPLEFLELDHQRQVTLHPIGFELGATSIRPRGNGNGDRKWVDCLRIYVDRSEKPFGVSYWDITAQGLIAQLMPLLDGIVKNKRAVTLTANGWGPQKRFSIAVS